MVARNVAKEKIENVLRRAGGVFSRETQFTVRSPEIQHKASIVQLLTPGYARGTLVLWLTYFMGLFVIYLLNGWLPTIMHNSGFSLERTAIIAGLFQLGGTFGGLMVGGLMDKYMARRVIAIFYLAGMACLLLQGIGNFGPTTLAVLVFFSGVCINGAQTGLQAFSPAFYPTEIRATGVCWMHGIGRMGAIISSSTGGILLGLFSGENVIFLVLALPALLAGLSILMHRAAHSREMIKPVDSDYLPDVL
ncbi:MFS transporter, partial [Winslowiella iniecta]